MSKTFNKQYNKSMRSPAQYHIFKILGWPLSSSVNTIQYRWFKICWWTFLKKKFFLSGISIDFFLTSIYQHTDIHNASESFSTEQLVYAATCNIIIYNMISLQYCHLWFKINKLFFKVVFKKKKLKAYAINGLQLYSYNTIVILTI